VLPESLVVYAGEEGSEAAVAGLFRRLQLLEHAKLRLFDILDMENTVTGWNTRSFASSIS
jgi:hypothetical protein